MQTAWIKQTKFMPPLLREDFVPRSRLQEALHNAVNSHALTLVSAPAGYGKTTLLVSFSGTSTAWLSLDEEDNNLARFFTALVIALQKLSSNFGENVLTLLSNLENPASEPRRIISLLTNEVMEKFSETWLILDDLHTITEPAVYLALDYLLEHIPPQLHIIASTRHDPPLSLARLRARGQLAELRAPDLRFTSAEAELFLNGRLHLNLSIDDLAKLQLHTEGWAAGLRLLAGSLDRLSSASDRAAFIHDLALTDRFVFDFLADEVLKRQEPEIRTFLLETSILAELTPSLCNTLTGRNDAQDVLEQSYRRNLFFTQVGETGKAYRYHALFAEFLQSQLKRKYPQRFAELHHNAARAQENIAPWRAVTHYLNAESWEEAARTIEQVSEEFLRHGYLQILRGWIDTLPTSVREAHPRLLYLSGLCALQGGELDVAMTLLESAQRGFESILDQDGQGETLLLMVDVASRQHDYTRQAKLAQQAMEFPLPLHGQVQLLMAQVWQALFQADYRLADEALEKAFDLTLSSDDLRVYSVVAPMLNMQLAFLPRGALRLERYCRHVLSRFGNNLGLVQACAHSLLGYILILKGSIDEALKEVEQARAIFPQIGRLAYTEAQTLYIQGIASALHNGPGKFEELWAQFLSQIEQTPMLRPYLVAAYYFIGRAQWMQNKLDQARQTEARIAAIADPEEYPETALARKLMRALIEISDRRTAEAESTLQQALHIEGRWPHTVIFGSARMLLAYLHLQCEREKEALLLFTPFLTKCELQNTAGLILQELDIAVPLLRLAIEKKTRTDFAKRLLDQLSASALPKPVPVPGTGQTLTPREVEVLGLIADGASNRVIAMRLVISEHTVKVHISNIFAKLQVTSRTQAISRAREMRLI